MSRARRVDVGGMIYHALNRASFRSRLFKTDAHYQDFLGIVEERRKGLLTPFPLKEDQRDVRQTVKEMLAFRDREGPTLCGRVTIRELIDEGRRS